LEACPWGTGAAINPDADGDSVQFELQDGHWIGRGLGEVVARWAPALQPGLWRVAVFGSEFNESPVSCRLRVTRENYRTLPPNRIAQGSIKWGDILFVPAEIPAGTKRATFELRFHRDWSKLPTSDVDLVILDSKGVLVSLEGATDSAPERAVLTNPAPGTYTAALIGYELYKPDEYELFLTLD
jgi:hypothetical protein